MNICPTMNSRFVQWVTTCSVAIRRFVPWVTTCFLSLTRNRCKNHSKQRSKNSLCKLLKEQDSQTQSMLVNCSERDRCAMLMEGADCTVLQRITRPRSIEGSRMVRNFLDEPKIGPVLDVFVSKKIKVSCPLTFKCRHHCMVLHGYE